MRKPRLFAKHKCKLPKPKLGRRKGKDDCFELRTINEIDKRYHVIRLMRQRVAKLMEDVNADTLAKEILASRAVYISSYLESVEVDSIEGKEMDWKVYLQAVRALADVLSKLGLEPAVQTTKRLEDYILEAKRSNGNGKHKVKPDK